MARIDRDSQLRILSFLFEEEKVPLLTVDSTTHHIWKDELFSIKCAFESLVDYEMDKAREESEYQELKQFINYLEDSDSWPED